MLNTPFNGKLHRPGHKVYTVWPTRELVQKKTLNLYPLYQDSGFNIMRAKFGSQLLALNFTTKSTLVFKGI